MSRDLASMKKGGSMVLSAIEWVWRSWSAGRWMGSLWRRLSWSGRDKRFPEACQRLGRKPWLSGLMAHRTALCGRPVEGGRQRRPLPVVGRGAQARGGAPTGGRPLVKGSVVSSWGVVHVSPSPRELGKGRDPVACSGKVTAEPVRLIWQKILQAAPGGAMASVCRVREASGPVSGADDLIGIVAHGMPRKVDRWFRTLRGYQGVRPVHGASPLLVRGLVEADGAEEAASSGVNWVGLTHRVRAPTPCRMRVSHVLARQYAAVEAGLMRPRSAWVMSEWLRVVEARMYRGLRHQSLHGVVVGELRSRQSCALGMPRWHCSLSGRAGGVATWGQTSGKTWVHSRSGGERSALVNQPIGRRAVSPMRLSHVSSTQGRDWPGPLVERKEASRSVLVEAPQYNHFHITQQPGQDVNVLVEEIIRRLLDRQAVQRRSWMFDGAGA